MKDTIVAHVVDFIVDLREEFKQLPFDFHSCFYFDSSVQSFKIHRQYLQ